jgi:hypothetical protein
MSRRALPFSGRPVVSPLKFMKTKRKNGSNDGPRRKMDRVVVDQDRANQVFVDLLRTFRARQHPFGRYRSIFEPPFQPENFSDDPKFLMTYFLVLCLWMKGQIESPAAHARLSRFAVERPEVFDPAFWLRHGEKGPHVDTLVEQLVERGLGAGVSAHRYHLPFNMVKVARHYGGDARRLFEMDGDWSFQKFLERVRNRGRLAESRPEGFFGFQVKMVALLAHFGVVVGAIGREHRYPLPVDIHVARTLLNTGALRVERSDGLDAAEHGWRLAYTPTVRAGVEASMRFLDEADEDSYDLAEAVWNYGLEMCAVRPSNWKIHGERCGRATVIVCEEIPDTVGQWRRFASACLVCAVRDRCNQRLSIGSKPYFINGHLEARPAEFPRAWLSNPMAEALRLIPPDRSLGKMGNWWTGRRVNYVPPMHRGKEPEPASHIQGTLL